MVLPKGRVLHAAAFPRGEGAIDWERPILLDDALGVELTEATYHETGLTRYNRKRFLAAEPRPVLETELDGKSFVLLGVETIIPHGFFYSTGGLAKHDAPPSFFEQMPYWPLFGALSRRVDAAVDFLDGFAPDVDVWLYEPSAGLPTDKQRGAFQEVQHLLMELHRDFLIVDEHILERRTDGVAEADSPKLLVVPPMRARPPRLQTLIDAWRRAGGAVLEIDEPVDRATVEAQLTELVEPSFPLDFSERGAFGGAARRVWITRRGDGKMRRWMLLNTGTQTAQLEGFGAPSLFEIVPGDGDSEGPQPSFGRRRLDPRRTIRPFESVLVCDHPVGRELEEPSHELRLTVPAQVGVETLEPNLYRMGWYRLALRQSGSDTWREVGSVEPKPIVNQLADSHAQYEPDYQFRFGVRPTLDVPRMQVRYAHEFHHDPQAGPVTVLVEPDGVGGDFELRVNGGPPHGSSDLYPVDGHMRGCRGAEITSDLSAGANTIELFVDVERHDDGLLAPLYLAGRFFVDHGRSHLEAPLTTGGFEEYERNGLAYYAGRVAYEFEADLPELARATAAATPGATDASRTVAVVPRFPVEFHEACTISFNGGRDVSMPWAPHVAYVPPADLRSRKNRVRLSVYSSLARCYEGTGISHQ